MATSVSVANMANVVTSVAPQHLVATKLDFDNMMDTSASTDILNVDSIDHRQVQGDIAERFNTYKTQLFMWTDPLQYRTKIKDNGNNIRYVVNPTKDDYLFAIEHGARAEFIDMNIVTFKEVIDFIDVGIKVGA